METKKVRGFGFRGWMLFIYQFLAFSAYGFFCNWPMNAFGADISGILGQGPSFVASISSIAMVIGIIIQLAISRNIGKIKSVKRFSVSLGIISMIFAAGVCFINPFMNAQLWIVAFGLESLVCVIWATFTIGILIGQWFPRRKGTFMGLVTISFPISNALMSMWIRSVFAGGMPNMAGAYLPYWIVCCLGLIIGIIFVPDFPEQVGAYRDNDKSITPEIANAMLKQEIENRRTTVWTLKETLTSAGFWLITLPMGFILMFSVGVMTQSAGIIGAFFDPTGPQFGMIMLVVAAAAVVGSYVIGLIDTKIGTRKAMMIAAGFMIAAGIIGAIQSSTTMIISLVFLGVFMGASSNFTVSGSVQYWRIEDFPSVFARVNPIANLMQAIAPVLCAFLLNALGYNFTFIGAGIAGVISMIMLAIFKPSMVKEKDDRLRKLAGKPLDDVLVGRK